MRTRHLLPFILLLFVFPFLLGSCGDSEEESGVGQTAADSAQTDDADSVKVRSVNVFFGPNDTTFAVNIRNNDSTAVRWRVINEDMWWLLIEPSTGRIPVGGMAALTVTADRDGLSEGKYSGVFFVSVGTERVVANVKLEVGAR